MANKICRCVILSFIFNESHKNKLYNNDDIINAIEYCQDYINQGYRFEYHDNFNLKDFIVWAKKELEI